MRAFEAAIAVPWAMQETALETLLHLASQPREERQATREERLQALAARLGRPLDNARAVTVRDGVAVIPVSGSIFRYANVMTEYCGATSLEVFATDFRQSLDDPQVTAILLEVDSPGGEIAGTAEMAQMIFAARGQKPCTAYVSALGASAAYWIAAAAEEVVCASTALLGSIGVVQARRRGGNDNIIEFVSSQSPNKRPNPETETGRAQIQATLDAVAAVFIADVARFRGVSEETVAAEFGQGGLFVGQEAVTAGLADRVGSFEEVLAELCERGQQARTDRRYTAGGRTYALMGKENKPMGAWDKIKAALVQAGILGEDGEATPEAAAQPAQPAAGNGSADSETALENARLRATLRQERTERLKADAETFAAAEVTAKRAYPSEKDALVAAYLQAAHDDADHPVASGETSRVGQLKAVYAKRPAHNLTDELVAAGQPDGGVALPAKEKTDKPGGEKALSAERRAELLGSSTFGRTCLADRK